MQQIRQVVAVRTCFFVHIRLSLGLLLLVAVANGFLCTPLRYYARPYYRCRQFYSATDGVYFIHFMSIVLLFYNSNSTCLMT